ncbi:MAG: ABC transporter ATP-binding protein [Vulcanimicrobiota bacterium]
MIFAELWRLVWRVIPPSARPYAALYLPASLLSGLLDLTSVAIFFPFLVAITNRRALEHHRYFIKIQQVLGVSSSKDLLVFLGVLILLSLVLREVYSVVLSYYTVRLNGQIQHALSERLLQVYLTRSYRFFLTRHSSDLSQNVLVRVNGFLTGIFQPMLALVQSVATFFVFLAGLLYLQPILALISLVTFGLIHLAIHLRLEPWLTELVRRVRDLNMARYRTAQEVIQGIREAKLLGCEGFFLESFARYNQEVHTLMLRRTLVNQLPRLVSRTTLMLLVVAAALGLVVAGQEQHLVPIMLLYVMLLFRTLPRIRGLFGSFTGLKTEMAQLEDIAADLGLERPDDRAIAAPVEAMPFHGRLELRGVGLSYDQARRAALADVNLTIEAGQKVAVVGRTGAGKTTLLDILTGLLAPSQGEVWVDGTVLADEPKEWRANIGYVSQVNYIIDAPLAHNIAFGVSDEAIDLDRVRRACWLAALDEFVETELPEGYKTIVGDRGVALSQGQRQRVGIARALYRDPSVVVLDEATSNLDPVTERLVLERISALEPSRTVIFVSHRIKTVLRFERIFVVVEGRLVGQGDEASLTQTCPEFVELLAGSD